MYLLNTTCLTLPISLIALDGHAPRVIAKRGQKKVRYRTSGNKNQLTVIACVSTSGQCIPPFVIFDAKKLEEW